MQTKKEVKSTNIFDLFSSIQDWCQIVWLKLRKTANCQYDLQIQLIFESRIGIETKNEHVIKSCFRTYKTNFSKSKTKKIRDLVIGFRESVFYQ